MVLSEYHLKVIKAEVCPYCKSDTIKGTETDVYGKEYKGRLMIICSNYPGCNSYVGCHEGGEPLGRLADADLRKWKIMAHNAFDKLWKTKRIDRTQAYRELSEALKLPIEYTHIGMFSKKTILKVIAWSQLRYNDFM